LPRLDSVEVPQTGVVPRGTFLKNLASLWSAPMARTTLMLWVLWIAITFSYYGFFTWIPTLLVKQGMTITRSFGYSIVIYLAQIPGYYSAAFVSEKLDRKWTIVAYKPLGGFPHDTTRVPHRRPRRVLRGSTETLCDGLCPAQPAGGHEQQSAARALDRSVRRRAALRQVQGRRHPDGDGRRDRAAAG